MGLVKVTEGGYSSVILPESNDICVLRVCSGHQHGQLVGFRTTVHQEDDLEEKDTWPCASVEFLIIQVI